MKQVLYRFLKQSMEFVLNKFQMVCMVNYLKKKKHLKETFPGRFSEEIPGAIFTGTHEWMSEDVHGWFFKLIL